MHELSIVTYVVKQVQEIAKENNLTEIESVTLEFGEVSGIVPEYLEDCWNWYTKKEPIIQGTKFLYEIIPAVTRSQALCRNILKIAGTGTPRKSRSFRARSSCMRLFRPSPGAMTARALTRPYNTARPAPTAAAATRGCSRVTRSISSKLRRADDSTPPCLWAAKETEAVAQPLLIEKQTKRE